MLQSGSNMRGRERECTSISSEHSSEVIPVSEALNRVLSKVASAAVIRECLRRFENKRFNDIVHISPKVDMNIKI
jgi:hypothetical protein